MFVRCIRAPANRPGVTHEHGPHAHPRTDDDDSMGEIHMKDKHMHDGADTVSFANTDTMTSVSKGALKHLDDLHDVKIADGEPDVRGWDVKDAGGRMLGKVADLLVDTGAMKVRYLELKLDEDVANEAAQATGELDPRIEATRHVLVPIGAASLDDDKDEVRLGARASIIAGVPSYSRDQMSREHESDVIRSYDGGDAAKSGAPADKEFYARQQFDDASFFGRRRLGREKNSYFMRSDTGADTRSDTSLDREIRREPVSE